ncbi:bifunctional glycosyltransferase/CDP-glycerol:glycerophosphate glycerophosphotransferase [Actinomadura roseirufa]|uniref:bifunctional glycosyltransferase/CDP-glycerol:glycerophosphate glycerophosphotransferase n=1 Tax=Actinomadura roseirufa TaxID=2094049 RepID=UPI0010411D5C|nr:bifunctional glycosyltransferase family 2 protein/CDP-glycerol:glycerophosphate glycerophosphotransferase [Actinomadura roseirufa]
MPPTVSVVVPFRDVGEYLAECLDSLSRQTLRDLEVIMVDDGSADGGAALAREAAERDDRFVLMRRDGAGPGPARNAGIARARGRYLAFADGDDALPPYAYELLVGTLESTGSDLAGGNVLRLEGERVRQSWVHAEPYAATVKATNITRYPVLVQDLTVWNKVYRRSFWDAHRFEFPAMLYEDLPVSIEAHVRAAAVDVLDATVYYWRRRPGSITQNRYDLGNIADRMCSLEMVRTVLGDHAPALLPAYDRHALGRDVRALIGALPGASEADRARLVERGAGIVAATTPAAVGGLPALTRLELHLLRERMLPELLELLRFEEDAPQDVPLVSRGKVRQRWYARYPFFGDAERRVPDEVYDVTAEFPLWTEVDRLHWDGGALVVEGHAHFGRLPVESADDSRIRIWMRDARTGKEVRLPVERTRCPEATARSGQSRVSYDWSGFRVRVEPEALQDGGEWPAATWELHAEVTTAGRRAAQRLTSAAPAVNWAAARQVDEHVVIQPAAGDGFAVHVKHIKAVVTGYRAAGASIELTGWTRRALGAGAALVAARRHGGAEVRGEVTLRPATTLRTGTGTGFDFTATLPLEELISAAGGRGGAHLRDVIDWDVRLTGTGGPLRLTVARNLAGARFASGDREFALTRTAYGNLRGVERGRRPVVTSAAWDAEDRLTLAGDMAGDSAGEGAGPGDRPGHLVLRRRRSGDRHRVPLTWAEDRFTAVLAPGAMPLFGERVPLAGGTWELLTPDGAAVVLERAMISRLPARRPVGVHEFEVGVHQVDALLLRARTALGDDERGRHAQRILRERDYPVYLRSPLTELAVFDSYGASQYSCNPRAVYEELTRSHPDLECVWISKDGQFTPEGDARTVLAGTREHYRTLARARYIVTNYGLPPWFTKRPDQRYLQTWHGTPLKRIAHDLKEMPYRRVEKLDWMEHEVPRWDVLLSPNPFTTEVMRKAFRYDGEILESGYPRNDLLTTPDFSRACARIRKRLGIPKKKKVVLYAPTWRDDLHHSPGRRGFSLELDVETLRRVLGKDHVLLVRTHYLVNDRPHHPENAFVMDVSRYPDIAELYLAADVLVTDYSSAMFDYACTGRPMVFYTYDLERYRDHVRGFSLDFEAEAPGPLLTSSGEVAEALRAIDDVQDRYVDAYDRFFDTYCPHDDGQASARAIARLLP